MNKKNPCLQAKQSFREILTGSFFVCLLIGEGFTAFCEEIDKNGDKIIENKQRSITKKVKTQYD